MLENRHARIRESATVKVMLHFRFLCLSLVFSSGFALAQCDGGQPVVTTIPVVRGQGSPSACAGKTVTVTGVVTAAFSGLNGFFLQDLVGDGDPTTSDGIFVLTGSPDYLPEPGSVAQITGKVIEFVRPGQTATVTEIDITAGDYQGNGAAPLPDPVVLDPGLDQPNAYLQALEGMLVSYPASTVVTPSDATGSYFALRNDRLPDGGRVTAGTPGTGQPIMIDTAGGALVQNLNELDTAPALTGVLHFDAGAFRLQPVAAYDGDSTGIQAAAVPADTPFLSVATLDCLRLTADLPAADKQRQMAKLVLAIQNELGSPDLIVVHGVGDSATILQLAQAAGPYLGLIEKGCDPSGTSMGLLFNIGRIIPVRSMLFDLEAPSFKKPACTLPDGQQFKNPLFENPLVRVDIVVDNRTPITLILNDWRSAVPDAVGQAQVGVAALRALLTNISADNIMLLGDFNQPETFDSFTTFEQDLGFLNLSRLTDPAARYSVTDSGRSTALDHIFVNGGLAGNILSSGFAHFNADFSVLPNRQDNTTPLRSADHDSPFVHLQPF